MRAWLAAVALLCCATDALTAQLAEHDGLARMLREAPHVRVVPGYTLLRGRPGERTLNARVQWASADASRLSVTLLGDIISSGRDLYSRSGLEAGFSADMRMMQLSGAGTVAVGAGAGPSQILSVVVSAGVPAVDIAFRTTWLRENTTASTPFGAPPQPAAPIEHGYTDGELRARVRAGSVHLRVTGGLRFGEPRGGPARWMWGEAAHPISRRFSIVASAGTRPRRPELAQHGGAFALLGIRLETGGDSVPLPIVAPPHADGVQVRPLGNNRYVLQIRVAGAQRVDLMGDITDWTAVPMRTASRLADVWELVLQAVPGIYAINIRTDGGDWKVPPGLVAVPDRFGGTAGMLTLPAIEEDDHEAG